MHTRFTWSRGGMFGSAATGRLAALIVALTLTCAAPCLSQTFATMPAHASFGLFPWERIDLATMGLTLSFTDFSFHGNSGFEFKVQRVFDPTMQKWRWFVGPEFPIEGGLEWGDGSRELFAPVQQGSCGTPWVWVSSSYGRLVRDTAWCAPGPEAHLDLPNGQIYYFDVKPDNTYLLNHMEDQHGNRVEVYRGVNDRIERVIQSVGSQTRVILFEYYENSDRLYHLSWNDQRWEYTWSNGGLAWSLVTAKPPVGPAWQFSGLTFPLTVTLPTGGQVAYSFGTVPLVDIREVQFGGGEVTGTRVLSGPGIAPLTWTFTWTGHDDPGDPSKFLRVSTVATPGGARYAEYTHSYGAGDSGLLTKVDVGYGTEVTTLEWQKGSIPLQAAIKKVHVQRENRHYERIYTYQDWSIVEVGRHTPDWVTIPHWGQPTSIEENGDLPYSRSTGISYEPMAYPYADQPAIVTLSGNGESYITQFHYYPEAAFLYSKTVYGITTTYNPDQYGNVWREIDGNGHTTSYTYNWGAVASVQTPEFTVTYGINEDGTVQWERRRGKQTNFSYAAGRLTQVTPPVGLPTIIEYHPEDNETDDGKSVTVRRGTSWKRTTSDMFGNPVETKDDLGVKTRTGYDSWNRVAYQGRPYINPDDDKGVSIYYDVLGRIYHVQNDDGRYTDWQWYSDPVKITQKSYADPSSEHTTEQDWKAMGSPSSAWLASETTGVETEAPQSTSYGYNLLGRLVQITSPEVLPDQPQTHRVRQWNYFPGTDRLQSVTIPEGGTQQWHYDAAGRVDSTTDASQHVTTYEYDGNNRLRFVKPWDLNYVEMQYDESDNRVLMKNADATTSFEYDDGNRLTKRTDVIAGHTFETIYTPNDYDQVTDVQYPSGNHVSYEYDPAHQQLARVYDDQRGIVFAHDFVFHPSGAIKSYVSGNGILNTTTYDPASGLLWHAASSSEVLDVQYGGLDTSGHFRVTDNFGNVTKITDSQLGTETFEPDDLNRLKVANGPWGKLEYAYTPVGNRESVTLTRDGVMSTTNYAYHPVTNRLSETSGAQTETFGHDASGRVTSDRYASLYSYTPSGLLETAAMRAGVQQTYRYNADDERVLKSVGNGDVRTYVVNGLSEFSTDGGPITWTVDYLYAGSRLLGAVRPAPGSVYTLTVTKPGNGAGRVSGVPAGLDCGPECSARYVSGTMVTLTATPEAASYFTAWGGACSGTTTTVTVTIDAVKTCTATFVSNKLTVTLAGSGTGTVSASGLTCQGTQCTGVYPLQTAVTLVATPGTGSAFAGWSGDTGCGGSVTMAAALNCTATFTLTTSSYTLTVLKTGEGSAGSVVTSTPPGISCGATCAASFISGTPVQLTATPATGYELAFWQGDGCATGTVTMTGARTCTAWFQPVVLPCNPTPTELQVCRSRGGRWDSEMCACRFGALDPLVLTLDGSPVPLTDLSSGVLFDVDGDGALEHVAWTLDGSSAGWLALDLNGDGAITTGAELLGTMVGRPRHARPVNGANSFTLLAAYDDPANGGNGDGVISAADAVFGQLRLWVDQNHDGVSQPEELMSLDTAGVVSIELSYQITGRRDGVGNLYRYRGTVHLTSGHSVPIWDVFLATTDAATAQVAVHSPRGFAAAVGHRLVQVGAWVRRALAPRTVSALTGIRSVRAPRSSAKSTTWWPTDSGPLAQVGPASASEAEPGDENSAPAMLQDPPPPPTQVVEYYHLDLLGSVRAVTNEQGLVIARHDFLPFGEELSPPTSSKDRKLFTGQERDFETGLDYFNARQYRPDLGQFTAPDPMSLAPSPVGSQALGSYTYVSNSPLDSVDPSGMWGVYFGVPTWGPGGASVWGYVGGGSWAGPSGWPGSGLSLGSLFGFSLSFSIGGSPGGSGQRLTQLDVDYAREFGGAGNQPSIAQMAPGISDTPSLVPNATGSVDDPFCSGPTCMGVLKKVSDFSAGMGDVLSVGTTILARKYIFHSDDVVDKGSFSYVAGAVTGVAVGAGIGEELAARPNTVQIRLRTHPAHHSFGSLGRLRHIQMNVWRLGVPKSGWALRIPLPW